MFRHRLTRYCNRVWILALLIGLLFYTIERITFEFNLLPLYSNYSVIDLNTFHYQMLQNNLNHDDGQCHNYEKFVLIVVLTDKAVYSGLYDLPLSTLHCYSNRSGYDLKIFRDDSNLQQLYNCRQSHLLYRKHCYVAKYLKKAANKEWAMVLDADTGVFNPNRCLDEFIKPGDEIIFYERFYNWEIASGNYIIKNTDKSRNFLMEWCQYDGLNNDRHSSYDNGALQIHFMRESIPLNDTTSHKNIDECYRLWLLTKTWSDLFTVNACIKMLRQKRRNFPNGLRIDRRAQSFVMDGVLVDDAACLSQVFMFHGWKRGSGTRRSGSLGRNYEHMPFESFPWPEYCNVNDISWPYKEMSIISCDEMLFRLIKSQIIYRELYSKTSFGLSNDFYRFLEDPDIKYCWPNCTDE